MHSGRLSTWSMPTWIGRQSSDTCLCGCSSCHTLPFLWWLPWTPQRFRQSPQWHFEGPDGNYSPAACTEDAYHHLVSKRLCRLCAGISSKKKKKPAHYWHFQSDRLWKCHSSPTVGVWRLLNSTTVWEKHHGTGRGNGEKETAPGLTLILLLCR